jgi:hypothetical protein
MTSGTNSTSRGGRRGNNDQQSGLQRQNTGPRDGNTTPQQGRRGGAGRGQNPNKPTENTTNGPALISRNDSKRSDAAAAPAQEEHIPVNDFNAQEVRVGLKNTSEVKPAIYKPAEKAAPAARSGSPWASKRTCYCLNYPGRYLTRAANMTASGKDFFVELRKQVALLQQSGGTTMGG